MRCRLSTNHWRSFRLFLLFVGSLFPVFVLFFFLFFILLFVTFLVLFFVFFLFFRWLRLFFLFFFLLFLLLGFFFLFVLAFFPAPIEKSSHGSFNQLLLKYVYFFMFRRQLTVGCTALANLKHNIKPLNWSFCYEGCLFCELRDFCCLGHQLCTGRELVQVPGYCM